MTGINGTREGQPGFRRRRLARQIPYRTARGATSTSELLISRSQVRSLYGPLSPCRCAATAPGIDYLISRAVLIRVSSASHRALIGSREDRRAWSTGGCGRSGVTELHPGSSAGVRRRRNSAPPPCASVPGGRWPTQARSPRYRATLGRARSGRTRGRAPREKARAVVADGHLAAVLGRQRDGQRDPQPDPDDRAGPSGESRQLRTGEEEVRPAPGDGEPCGRTRR
jgi:hypothetical protein